MRTRTSCSSAVPHQCASLSSSVWEWIALLNSAQHGGENQKNQRSHCSQDGILWHFTFASRGTGFCRGAPSSEPCVTKCPAQDPYFPNFFLGGRKDKAAMQTPQRCVASFLMGWLSNATKTSLPEGLCSLKLSRVHPLGGRQVKKKTWFWPRLLFEAIKKQYYLLHEQTNEKIRWRTNWSSLKTRVIWSGNYCASANLLFNKTKYLCSITNTNNSLFFFFLQNQHAVSQTFELFLSVFLGNVHSFE